MSRFPTVKHFTSWLQSQMDHEMQGCICCQMCWSINLLQARNKPTQGELRPGESIVCGRFMTADYASEPRALVPGAGEAAGLDGAQ